MIFPVLLSLFSAGMALVALKKKQSLPGENGDILYVPAVEEILSASTFAVLDAYYNYIGNLYITGLISVDTYHSLYQAYYSRWDELDSTISQEYRYDNLPAACVCDNCGYILENPETHCKDIPCPICGETMWRLKV